MRQRLTVVFATLEDFLDRYGEPEILSLVDLAEAAFADRDPRTEKQQICSVNHFVPSTDIDTRD